MVKRIIGSGLLLMGVLLSTAQGDAQFNRDSDSLPKSFLSRKDWRGLSKGEQQAYAVGVVDGLDLAYAYGQKTSGIALQSMRRCIAR